ncbi:hypothetical protein V6N13_013195 [Hibiscus sabdariffa]
MVKEQEPLATVALPREQSSSLLKEASVATSLSDTAVATHTIQRTAAYLASNPEKKSKSAKAKESGVSVVPMIVGQSTKVSTHTLGSSRTHAVVSIVEKGHGDYVRAWIRQPALHEWVQHVSNKIVEIGNQVGSAGTDPEDPTGENAGVLAVPSESECGDDAMTDLVADDAHANRDLALVQIDTKKGPMAGGGCDLVGWKGRVDLHFSVKYAHSVCTGRNSIAFDTLIEDTRPILDRCHHLRDIASRALQRVNGTVIGSISKSARESNAAAYAMAKLVRVGDLDRADFAFPPASLHLLLQQDLLHANTAND